MQADGLHDEADAIEELWQEGNWNGLIQWGIISKREAKVLEEAEMPPWEK